MKRAAQTLKISGKIVAKLSVVQSIHTEGPFNVKGVTRFLSFSGGGGECLCAFAGIMIPWKII